MKIIFLLSVLEKQILCPFYPGGSSNSSRDPCDVLEKVKQHLRGVDTHSLITPALDYLVAMHKVPRYFRFYFNVSSSLFGN